MFSSVDRNPNYLKLSAEKRRSLEENLNNLHNKLWQTPFGKLKSMWLKNRIIFFVDEAEFAVFTFIGTIFNKLELTLWVLAISQVLIAIFRFYERISQINSHSPKLLEPLRK